jgi:holo-[acyl-carrier protein] synthase
VIVGIGVDLCDVARFDESLRRTPELAERLFTSAERGRSVASLAARFAAKEALAKALGAPVGLGWHDAEVVTEETGRPRFVLTGTVAEALTAVGGTHVHLSLTHDGGLAAAYVVVEGRTPGGPPVTV